MGLAAGLLGQIGQSVGQAANRFADVAVAPFQELFSGPSSRSLADSAGTNSTNASANSTDSSGAFASLYSQFEQAISRFLTQHPELPKLRIQISDDSKVRLQAAEPTALTPETAQLLADIEEAINHDHDLSRMAGQLYESKSRERWRLGLSDRPANVELIIDHQKNPVSMGG